MTQKSFRSAPARGVQTFDINDVVFQFTPDIPGAILMDFMSNIDDENPASMVKVLNKLLESALAPAELERFNEFVRDPSNNVSLELLAEICGFIAENASGNEKRPTRYGPG